MAQECCWHCPASEEPPAPEQDLHPPTTSTVQGAAGIVPLDGAIVKELGFAFQTPGRTCSGSAGQSWPSLPWSEDASGMQRRGRRDGSPTESVGSWQWEK